MIVKFEREILEELAGMRPPSTWGAAVGVALETLVGHGYCTKQWAITSKGLKFLNEDKSNG